MSYDPRTNSWSRLADAPLARYENASAVLNGKLYLIGGRDGQSAALTSDVQVYDPKTNRWSAAATYPSGLGVINEACGAIASKLYCAGGLNQLTISDQSYVYDPQTNTWSPIASLPIPVWDMAYTAANGTLLTSGGITAGEDGNPFAATNQGFAYDPKTNTWTALPDADQAGLSAGACGFYRIGGDEPFGSSTLERLSGYIDCNTDAAVPWVSTPQKEITIGPGEEKKLQVTLEAGAGTQPGVLNANLVIHQNTPYDFGYIPVSLTVH
jgi:N-acetylneuraminic acid mutarotase